MKAVTTSDRKHGSTQPLRAGPVQVSVPAQVPIKNNRSAAIDASVSQMAQVPSMTKRSPPTPAATVLVRHGTSPYHSQPQPYAAKAAVQEALLASLAKTNPYWQSEHLLRAVESNPRAVQTDKAHTRDPHYQLGLLLGPAYAAFARHVLEHAEQFDRIYFLSREGWMFMRMYHRLARALGVRQSKPKGTYLVLNRKLSFLASMDKLSIDEIARFWQQYPGQSINRLLRNLSLPKEIFLPLAAEHGFANPREPIHQPYRHRRLNAFLNDSRVQRLFVVERDMLREKLLTYLKQRGFFEADRVALVDIGWKGSIQTNLRLATKNEPNRPHIHGIYFGLTHQPNMDAPGSTRHGFFCDSRAHDWTQECIVRNNAVFEMFATAPHGSASGYERDSRGWVHARTQIEDAESDNFRGKFRQVWRGIDDWFTDYLDTPEALVCSASKIRPAILERLRRYILYPTHTEAKAFLDYSHVENFGIFCVSRFNFQSSRRHLLFDGPLRELPYRFVQALRTERWPEGVCKRSGIPFATFLFDLVDTRKYTR